jgi:pimeloyl-ACP methyl ester carboxylesterase
MPHIETPAGIRIRYDERGPADGRPLVLAHGFGVGLEMWFPQFDALSHAHRLITWDARGHGGSSAPEDPESYTMSALAEDLRGLLEALDATRDAVIGGMSFGGMIALQYAVDHAQDVHALVISDSVPRDERAPVSTSRWADAYAGDPGLEGGMHAMATRPDLAPHLGTLGVPTLAIVGTDDARILEGLPRLIDALPRRRVVRLAGCGHGTSGQRPRAWNDAVLRFLADVDAGAPLGEDETV